MPAFVIGMAAGIFLSTVMKRRRVRRRLAVVLGLELVLLGDSLAYSTGPHPTSAVPLTTLGVAMGLQSAVVRHVAGADVRTTFVTGMVVRTVDALALAWLDRDRKQRWVAAFRAGIWLSFFTGAVGGAAGALHVGTIVLLVPMALVAAFAVLDVFRPEPLDD